VIVVDLGCHTHGDADSIHHLIERFNPRLLYGFDPHPENIERVTMVGTTTVVTARRAAWTADRPVSINLDGSRTRISDTGPPANAFDVARWLRTLPRVPTVLKMDVEGAEYKLLPHLRANGVDALIDLILVEWHGVHAHLGLACAVEEWTT
jgi:FkbM family methyltransferase